MQLPRVVELKAVQREEFQWSRFRVLLDKTVLGLFYFAVMVQIPMGMSSFFKMLPFKRVFAFVFLEHGTNLFVKNCSW